MGTNPFMLQPGGPAASAMGGNATRMAANFNPLGTKPNYDPSADYGFGSGNVSAYMGSVMAGRAPQDPFQAGLTANQFQQGRPLGNGNYAPVTAPAGWDPKTGMYMAPAPASTDLHPAALTSNLPPNVLAGGSGGYSGLAGRSSLPPDNPTLTAGANHPAGSPPPGPWGANWDTYYAMNPGVQRPAAAGASTSGNQPYITLPNGQTVPNPALTSGTSTPNGFNSGGSFASSNPQFMAMLQQMMAPPSSNPNAPPSGGFTPDQFLANTALTGGMPLDATTAFQNMVKAQQQNIDQGQANLAAQFGAAGNTGSDYQKTAQMYMNQAIANQNAQLSQMQLPLLQQMSQQSYGATGQLSNQSFQSQMQQAMQAYQAAQSMYGGGVSAAQALAAGGIGGANQLQGGALQGMQDLFSASTSAAQQQASLSELSATNLGQLLNQTQQTGAQLGQQQYNTLQSQINNAYQEWLRTQPGYNPLLQMLQQSSLAYPPMYTPGYQPSTFSQLANSFSSLASGAFDIWSMIP